MGNDFPDYRTNGETEGNKEFTDYPTTERTDGKKKGPNVVVIVLIVVGILVAVLVIGGIIFAGATFLWASSFEDTNEETNGPVMTARIDPTTNELTITVISGEAPWEIFRVTAEDVELTTTSTVSVAGSSAVFTSPRWDPVSGADYKIDVIDSDNRLLWSQTVTAI
jgi:hypothetical protein